MLTPRKAELVQVPAVLFSIGILWFTVDRWAKWFFGVCCVTASRAIVMSALGRTMSVPSIVAPRSYLVGLAAASVLMAFLSTSLLSLSLTTWNLFAWLEHSRRY